MKRKSELIGSLLAFFIIGGLIAIPAQADKPGWAGGDKGGGNIEQPGKNHGEKDNRHSENAKGQNDRKSHASVPHPQEHGVKQTPTPERPDYNRRSQPLPPRSHFKPHQGTIARDYYHHEFDRGFCPPGLIQKRNGCRPPGQAKKWRIGRPLPRGVIYYDLPRPLVVDLGAPPPGYRYVRIASDILLITIGTGMVVDAISDFTR